MLLPFPAFAQDFTIDHFRSEIVISKDASLLVRERLDVGFLRPRHGIYREIPVIYSDTDNTVTRTPLRVLSVTDGEGRKLKYKITREGNAIHVRIGDPDQYISGRQTYEILYEVKNAILFFNDHDELFWNVTGNEWPSEIRSAECSVTLPDGKGLDARASCYTGMIGSTEAACTYSVSDHDITFKTARNLSPGEGLTVAYGWDKGIVSPPSAFMKFLWLIDMGQPWIFLLPLLSLAVMFRLWSTRGRDPRVREAVTVMYGPPRFSNVPLSPAEVGVMVDERLDPKDITATIVGLAVKGYIKIEETIEEGILFHKKDCRLTKTKEPDDSLTLFEKQIVSDLFGSSIAVSVSALKNKFYTKIDALKKTMYSELISKKYFLWSPDHVRNAYAIAGVIVGGLSLYFLDLVYGSRISSGVILLAGVLTGAPVLGFSRYMPAKTRSGAAAYMDILGFEEFLNRAEKDQLERMKDENLFSSYFPYALALHVADNWARAFEGIYQKPPDWYVSPGGFRTFSPSGFTHSISSSMSSLSSAMYSAPRSSGSGGGGSSGGGYGGGGGGSW